MNMSSRISKIQNLLGAHDAFLVSDGANRFYLTGFNSSAGNVLITKSDSFFLIDFRYYEKAKKIVPACNVVLCSNFKKSVLEILNKENIKNLYIEPDKTSLSAFFRLQNLFPNIKISTDDVLQNFLLECRSIKSSEEISKIKQAQKLTDEAFSYILGKINNKASEKSLALELEFFMRKQGSEGVSFDFIVVSGKNSSLPHGTPTDKILQNGDFITFDFGAVVDGYRSDMTRTVALGFVSEKQKMVYDTVKRAQKIAISEILPGKKCLDIDKTARDYIYKSGFEGCFGHGLGHSVGIEIHENPSFNTTCETLLCENMVITVEPGIYIENEFGVRIEDMIIVNKTGCEDITESTDELLII